MNVCNIDSPRQYKAFLTIFGENVYIHLHRFIFLTSPLILDVFLSAITNGFITVVTLPHGSVKDFCVVFVQQPVWRSPHQVLF